MSADVSVSWSVLIVDDNIGFAELLSRAFVRDGRFEVIGTAANGAEGLDMAQARHPDVVILDDEMPVMTGLAVLPELVAKSPGSRVIFFSANLHAGTTARVLELGAAAAVSKLEPLRTLFLAVEEALKGG